MVTNYRVEFTAPLEVAMLVSTTALDLQSYSLPYRQQVSHTNPFSGSHYTVVCWETKKADKLTKFGSSQARRPASYSGAKTIIKYQHRKLCNDHHKPPSNDQMPRLSPQEQTTILRLRTGYCRPYPLYHSTCHIALPAHVRQVVKTPEHILQLCLHYREP